MSLTKVSYSMIAGAPVNVLDYGASPSASGAANLSAIQAAIDSLPNTGGSVYIPAGNYTVDGTITFPTNNIILFGDGGVGYEAIVDKGTTLNFTNATIGFDLTSDSPTGTFGSEINNLLIYGNSVLLTGVKSSRKLSMTNVCITGCVNEGCGYGIGHFHQTSILVALVTIVVVPASGFLEQIQGYLAESLLLHSIHVLFGEMKQGCL